MEQMKKRMKTIHKIIRDANIQMRTNETNITNDTNEYTLFVSLVELVLLECICILESHTFHSKKVSI